MLAINAKNSAKYVHHLITAGALALVLSKTPLADLARVFRNTRIGWFLCGEIIFGIILLVSAWRWHLMLRLTGAGVHPAAAARLAVIGHALNLLLLTPAEPAKRRQADGNMKGWHRPVQAEGAALLECTRSVSQVFLSTVT